MPHVEITDMTQQHLGNKRLLIREDLNVPVHNGKITDDTRILRALPTIKLARDAGARVVLVSHFGRPKEGHFDPQYSLAPVAERLSELLGQPVKLLRDWQGTKIEVASGEVVLLENVRFCSGEKTADPNLSAELAGLCDIFVMDAFAAAHRAHASTVGVARVADEVVAGPLLKQELAVLSDALDNPARPLVAIVGGSKVSTKLQLLERLIDKVDKLIVGGGIANTFLKAQGYAIGKSLYEADRVAESKKLLQKAAKKGVEIPLPVDVVVAERLDAHVTTQIKPVDQVAESEAIFDVGPQTRAGYPAVFADAATIVWNGPVGVFEIEAFAGGTKAMAEAIAASNAFSVAGGGDTLAALAKFGVGDQISCVSTGGGAFLAYLEGSELPGVAVLRARHADLSS